MINYTKPLSPMKKLIYFIDSRMAIGTFRLFDIQKLSKSYTLEILDIATLSALDIKKYTETFGIITPYLMIVDNREILRYPVASFSEILDLLEHNTTPCLKDGIIAF